MRGRERRSRLCQVRAISFSWYCLRPPLTHIISYITRTQAQAEGAPPLGRGPARSAAPPSPKSLQSNEASKSTALKVRCTMARASCGLMYWMGRDNGNEHSFRKPRLPGPSAGWNPAPSKRSLGRSARGAVRGRHPFAARARSSAGMPDRAAHGYAGRRPKEGGAKRGKGKRGREQGERGDTWHVICKVYIF